MLKTTRTSVGARAADERGSVMVAMMAVMVSLLAVIALISTVEGGLKATRTDQDRINAFQHANAGIDLALYRIDRQAFTGGNVVVTGAGFTDSVEVDGSTFDITATRSTTNAGSWVVRSMGTDSSGRRRLAIATLSAPRLFSHGFFTLKEFYLKGEQLSPTWYDSARCEDPRSIPTGSCVDPTGKGDTSAPGRIGTNHVIDLASATAEEFKARWEGFDMYGRATQEAADEACDDGNCGTYPVVRNYANQLHYELPAQPAGLSCPTANGHIEDMTIPPGDYSCAQLELEGVVTTNGRVRIWVHGPLSIDDDATVNVGKRSTNLQIFQEADGDGAWNGSICGAEVWAVLYTPGLEIDCEGDHQPTIYGAVLAQVHLGNGNHFDFHWDISARDLLSKETYVVTDWRECAPNLTDC